MTESRRTRLYYLREPDVLHAFLGEHQFAYAVPKVAAIKGIPEDAVIERVFHDPAAMAFVAIVSHESFDEVPAGQYSPRADGLWDLEYDVLYRTEIDGQECYQFRNQIPPDRDLQRRLQRHRLVQFAKLSVSRATRLSAIARGDRH